MGLFKCISRLMILCGSGLRPRSFSFVLVASVLALSMIPPDAEAAVYSWQRANQTQDNFPDPASACQAYGNGFNGSVIPVLGGPNGTLYFDCTLTGTAYPKPLLTWVARRGDGCATGVTYNPSTGTCGDVNKCAILKDTAIPSFKFKSTTESPNEGAGIVSKNGCAIRLGSGLCVTRTAPLYDCTFSGVVTGDLLEPKAGQGTEDCTGAQCAAGQPQKEVKDDPCAAIPAGSGFTCTATKSEDNPGKSQCGSANGAWVCVDNPKPTSNVSKSDISQTVTSNADGSTTTKTTTTTTTTNCQGIGNCSTGTTTTVVTGGTNPNGTNKPPSSVCTGPECGGGKVGGGNGNGSGSAGEGDGEDKPEDDDSVSGDMVCTALVSCSGDVIQCAILRQEQQSRCADEKFRDISDGPVNDAKAALSSEFAGNDYKPLKAEGDDVQDFSSVIKMDSFLSKACPVLPSVDIPYQQFKTRIDFNMSGLCDFLTYIGYINVAFALYKAAEIVGRGV